MQLDNQKEIAEMQNETQKEIAGIQSATSRQNTKDQVYAQNEMLAYQQKESTARVASIMENTNLSKQHFFFNITPTTEIYTLSLHDALPISMRSSTASTGNNPVCSSSTRARARVVPNGLNRSTRRARSRSMT